MNDLISRSVLMKAFESFKRVLQTCSFNGLADTGVPQHKMRQHFQWRLEYRLGMARPEGGRKGMRVVIDLNVGYTNVLSLTAIGNYGLQTRVTAGAVDLSKYTYVVVDTNGKMHFYESEESPDEVPV